MFSWHVVAGKVQSGTTRTVGLLFITCARVYSYGVTEVTSVLIKEKR